MEPVEVLRIVAEVGRLREYKQPRACADSSSGPWEARWQHTRRIRNGQELRRWVGTMVNDGAPCGLPPSGSRATILRARLDA